jgi:hypothetical protein
MPPPPPASVVTQWSKLVSSHETSALQFDLVFDVPCCLNKFNEESPESPQISAPNSPTTAPLLQERISDQRICSSGILHINTPTHYSIFFLFFSAERSCRSQGTQPQATEGLPLGGVVEEYPMRTPGWMEERPLTMATEHSFLCSSNKTWGKSD